METVHIKINNVPYEVAAGSTILEAAHSVGIEIPTLCYLKEINEIGACRICVVEVKGARSLVTACVYPVNEGMEIVTNSEKVQASRKTNLELLLSTHDQNCLSCVRSTDCELQKLCRDYGVNGMRFIGSRERYAIDDSAPHMVRDDNKCILCRRCVAACKANQAVGVIGANERGFSTHIGCAFEAPLGDSPCVSCGQCITVCPTGALTEKDDTAKVWTALRDPSKHVVVQPAPSVRATLGECFGMPIGTNVEGKMVAALRRLGFDGVFDTDTAADFTIMEEATEFVQRVKNGGTLPLITSCSPGWVKFCETYYPDMIPNLSSCKSPQQMFGALTKTYYAEKMGLDPHDIVCVSVMPCTAKKFEIGRDDMSAAGDNIPDVDISITTRERCGHHLRRYRRRDGSGPAHGCGACDGRDAGESGISRRARHRRHQGGQLRCGRPAPERVRGQRPHQLRRSAEGYAERREALRLHRIHGMPGRLCKRRRPAHAAGQCAQLYGPEGPARRSPVRRG